VLAQTKAAFTPGFSTLLIQENVLPNQGCPKRGALGDFAMMQHMGMERNEDQWRQLLTSGGFEIVRIWRAELGTTAIIEAELMEKRGIARMDGSVTPAGEQHLAANAYAGFENGFARAANELDVTPNGSATVSSGPTFTTEPIIA
jgi:hypothetical protein